jgi:hypothetical protein
LSQLDVLQDLLNSSTQMCGLHLFPQLVDVDTMCSLLMIIAGFPDSILF